MIEAGIHLKQARKKSGLAPEWVAQAVGVNLPSYYDMEDCDDLYMCTSLREIQKLCEILSITPEYLFTGETARPSGVQPDFSGLAQAIGRYCEEHHLSIPEFENRVGWELEAFLHDSSKAWEWNVDGLRDVCAPLQIDWLAVLALVCKR